MSFNPGVLAATMVTAVTPAAQTKQAGWTPLDIPNLWLWLSADALGLSDGNAVSAWADRSGNGRDFGQATGDNQPTYQTNVQSGLPVVRFDGTNDLLTSDATQSLAQPCTYFFVASRTGNLTAFNVLLTQSTETLAAGFDNTADEWYTYDGTTIRTRAGTSNAFHILTAQFGANGDLMRTDGTQSTVVLADVDATTLTFDIGATNAAGAPLAGDIGEMIVYNALLSAAQIGTVETWLSGKWGITLA